jgi:HK97 gp10 family phage protein
MAPLFGMTSNAAALARRVDQWSSSIGPALAVATLKAATVVTAAAKREAPVAKGRLRRSIAYQVAGDARYVVAPHTDYAVPVHEGSKAYDIRPRGKKALFWKGAAHPVKVVHQPARTANKFMTRAVANSRPQLRRIAAEAGHTIVLRQG